jgi:uncharacterized protein YndB with AHSA1/START domain
VTNQEAGRLEACGDGEWRIHFARRLPYPPERVWAALVEPARQERWLPGVTVDATEGGAVVFDFGEDDTAKGKVLAVEPGRLLEHDWLWPDEPPSTVRWELTGDGEATALVLRHEPVREEPAVDHCAGWHVMLDALAVYLSGEDPAELTPDYDKLYELYHAEQDAAGS